jgi:2-haloacid dehalogenase
MKKYTTILWDLDQTILDFDRSMYHAIRASFAHLGLEINDEIIERYAVINDGYWKRLELGEVTKEEVLLGRFNTLFEELGITQYGAEDIADYYQEQLGNVAFFLEDADKIVSLLHEKGYRQYVLTNGVEKTQRHKMQIAGLDQWIDGVFVSEEVGYPKPMKEYYDFCFSHLESISRDECLAVGDSLTSDIKGANLAGMASCWYNPEGKEKTVDVRVDYEINRLRELLLILGEDDGKHPEAKQGRI